MVSTECVCVRVRERARGELTIKVQNTHRSTVNLIESSQSRQGQAVVATERHELRLGADRGRSLVGAKLLQSLGHLFARDVVIERSNGDISTVDNLGPVAVWVNVRSRVEASECSLTRRSMANGTRAKAGAYTFQLVAVQ